MKAQFDMKQLKEFQKELEEAGKQVNMDAFYESAAKELAARMLALVKPRTPVGKLLKSGWIKGRFMMKISAQDLEKATPAILQKKLAAYLKKVLENGK